MSAEARATLIVEAKTDGAEAALGKLGAGAKQTGKEAKGMGEGFGGAVESLTGFNVASLAGIGGVTALIGGMKASIDKTMQWTDEIDRLSRATGESAAQTSLMATIFGDVGISVGTLESSFKVLTKNGLQPNMETFKKLATEYQAIEDPVKRNEFAMKNLGRSAKEMTEILSKTPAELDALTAAAMRSGKVIDEEMIAKSEKLAIQMQQLQDKTDGLMIAIGGPLVDTLSKAADGFDGLNKIIELNTVNTQLQYGAITEQEAQLRRLEIATGGTGEAWETYNASIAEATDAHERASATTQVLTAEQQALDVQTMALNSTWQSYVPTVSDAVLANEEQRRKMEELTGVASDLEFGLGEVTKATIFHQAAQLLDDQAAFDLAKSMGLVTEKSDGAKTKLDELAQQLADKKITTDEYSGAVKILGDTLEGLPDNVPVTITVETLVYEARVAAANANLENLRDATGNISGQASGGQVFAGQPYIVGDAGKPELFVPNTSGYVYPSVPNGDNTSATGMSNVFNIYGATDPDAVAREVQKALDGSGRRADRRMRI